MFLRHLGVSQLVIGRHAYSVANHALKRDLEGDETHIEKLRHMHTSQVKLAPDGVRQSVRKGQFLREIGMTHFDAYYTSSYARTKETAQLMSLPGAHWLHDHRLDERDWGKFNFITEREKLQLDPDWEARFHSDPLHWRPHGGQTRAEKNQIASAFLHDITHRHARKKVIIVGHYETNLGLQMCIEHITPVQYIALRDSLDMENATLIEYRENDSGTLEKRRINPHKRVVSSWIQIHR
ncbi:hypothetical protein EBR66_08665 [bacterium]|nr:hypothetical protein [bacterium]